MIQWVYKLESASARVSPHRGAQRQHFSNRKLVFPRQLAGKEEVVSKKQQQKAAPAATTPAVQQPQGVAPWLQPYASEFALVDRYLGGDTSVADQVREAFSAKLNADNGSHKGPVDNAFGRLVTLHGVPSSIFVVVYGEKDGGYKAGRAEEFLTAAREAGTHVKTFSKQEAQRVLEAWEEKTPTATESGARKSVMAMLSTGGNSAASRFPLLHRWANSGQRRERDNATEAGLSNAMKVAALESQVADLETREASAVAKRDYTGAQDLAQQAEGLRRQIAELQEAEPEGSVVETATAPEPTLQERIADLETRRDEAGAAKRYAEAARLDGEAEELRKQLSSTPETTAPATAEPEPAAPAATPAKPNGGDALSLSQAIAACKAADSKRLKKVMSRYNNDENFGDEEFVATVQALL